MMSATMRGSLRLATALAGLALPLPAAVAQTRTAASADAGFALPAAQVVGVSGTSLTLNGADWLPRGVNISGLEATEAFFAAHYPAEVQAREAFGLPELAAAQRFGADTLRIQVSQPSLDPQSPLFDVGYVVDVLAAIEIARLDGFVVVIMMQDEAISGEPTPHPLAIAETMRDWDLLNFVFGRDRGILFELYNEPEIRTNTAADWALWKNGGTVAGQSTPSIGMQTMITHLRAEDCQNVFVLDGLDFAHTLAGVPAIQDPAGRLVYAVHPYFDGKDQEATWDGDFGSESRTLPVFADEWSAEAGGGLGLGQLPSFQESVDFLNYLRAHRIPLAGGAFDRPGFMVQDVPGWTPSNYDDYSPSAHLDDAGLLVTTLFHSFYSRPLTDADAVTH